MAEPLQSREDGGTPGLAAVAGTPNVLLQSPSLGPGKTKTCHRLLGQAEPDETHVLAVTFTGSPDEWVAEWNQHAGESPARGSVVAVGEATPSVDDPAWTVEHVEKAADLTTLGIKLSNQLSTMATLAEANGGTIAVCFDSITSLLQYADLQATFRFLHVVTGRVKSAGGVGHYHVDPAAHDDQTLATLMGLFDAVVDVDEDGTVTVRR